MADEKCAYVTGASRGIGKAIALQLSAAGYRIGLLARSKPALEAVCDEARAAGGIAEYVGADLTSVEATTEAVLQLQATLGSPQVVVHNAGIVVRQPLLDTTFAECEAILRLNLLAPIQITKLLLPAMIEARCGHLLFVSSIAGKVPLPGGSVYAASKFGLTGFAESLLGEIRGHDVRVTTIFPGSVQRDVENGQPDAQEETPSWKLAPEDIAGACVYAVSQPTSACVSQIEVRPLRTGG